MTTAPKTKRTTGRLAKGEKFTPPVKSTRTDKGILPLGKHAPKSKAKPVKAAGGNTFTTVDIAKQHAINPKTLRARIRRNIDDWAPLFKNGVKHVFADNKTTHAKVDALLA